MTPDQFTAWHESMGYRWARGARELGITEKTSQRYRRGDTVVPLSIQLAMSALKMGLRPWQEYGVG